MTLTYYISKQSPFVIGSFCFVSIILFGLLDYTTGPEIGFSLFYLLPIAGGTWFIGKRTGIALAFFGATTWLAADLFWEPERIYHAVPYWNAIVRFAIFLIISSLLSRLKEINHTLEEKVREKTIALRSELRARERTQADLVRINRLYAVLSNVNQSIVRISNEHELFEKVCQIAVKDGQFRMVWIGLIDEQTQKVRADYSYGIVDGYLDQLDLSLNDAENETTPSISAIKSGKEFICNDIELDERSLRWRDRALKNSYRSCASFPLKIKEKSIGAISFYAETTDFFDTPEINLLAEMATDVSFFLGIRETDNERIRAEILQHAVYRIAEAANTVDSLNDIFSAVHHIIKDVMPAENFYIALFDKSDSLLRFPYFVDEVDEPFPPKNPGKGLTEYILRTGEPLLCDLALYENLIQRGEVERIGTPSPIWLGVPLNIDGETIGVMAVQHYSDEKAYGEREKDVLLFVSTQVAKAIERKLAQDEIKTGRDWSNTIFEASRDGIIVEENDVIVYANRSCSRHFGYENPDEIIGKHITAIYADHEVARLLELSRRRTKDEFAPPLYDFKGKRKDGSVIDCEVSVSQTKIGGKHLIIGIIRDIADRKHLHAQLVQSQKMESLGTLAGGIAHDFNNILSIILVHLSALERGKPDPEKFAKSIDSISKATMRGAALVKQLLTFARKTESFIESVRVNEVIAEVQKLLYETFPKTITVSSSLKSDLPSIIADATQIHQVLLNLCVNARDAMLKGGSLSITTDVVEGAQLRSQFPAVEHRQYITIVLKDTGTGMEESVRQRIFEPFYTTKGLGKGTGLGLSLVFGIVESHHGFIDVHSEQGVGTIFTVYLPVQDHVQEPTAAASQSANEAPGGTETILLIEDEPMIREFVMTALVSKGYMVIDAGNGREGVEKYAAHQKEIAIVISDIGLPELSGEDVFREIRKSNPHAIIILASGFIDPEMKAALQKEGAEHFIQKPYSTNDVLLKIRTVLDGKV